MTAFCSLLSSTFSLKAPAATGGRSATRRFMLYRCQSVRKWARCSGAASKETRHDIQVNILAAKEGYSTKRAVHSPRTTGLGSAHVALIFSPTTARCNWFSSTLFPFYYGWRYSMMAQAGPQTSSQPRVGSPKIGPRDKHGIR